ncbi:MAG: hypothetical protein ABFD16_09300, partial [Thermoguttaceae bacterium]|jgi:sRNA-binding carbon storage regulator CsrA
MVIATYAEGDLVHLGPALEMVVLGVGNGKVKLGLSLTRASRPDGTQKRPLSGRLTSETRTATIAILAAKSDGSLPADCVSDVRHNGLITVHGRAPSYYRSQPGQLLMLVVTCEENQRIRINDVLDLVVLDIHDTEAVRGLACPTPIRYTARRLVERLHQAQGGFPPHVLDGLRPQAAFSR